MLRRRNPRGGPSRKRRNNHEDIVLSEPRSDRSRRRPRDKRIYAIRASEGLVVKRANKAAGGRLLMTSDNPT